MMQWTSAKGPPSTDLFFDDFEFGDPVDIGDIVVSADVAPEAGVAGPDGGTLVVGVATFVGSSSGSSPDELGCAC